MDGGGCSQREAASTSTTVTSDIRPAAKDVVAMMMNSEENTGGNGQTLAVMLLASPAPTGNNSLKCETVSCIVKNKERLLGHVYLNGNGTYVEYICTGIISYKPGDSVYLEKSSRRDRFEKFNIVKITDFFRYDKDGCLYVRVRGYQRFNDGIPASWSSQLKNRESIENSGVEIIAKDNLHSTIASRELIFSGSDSDECYPVSALRGISQVRYYKNETAARAFKPLPDCFYYIFHTQGNTKDKKLASQQGEIRVGTAYQARLPNFEKTMTPDYMARASPEEALWQPQNCDDEDEFGTYQTSVRSMYTYRNLQMTENDLDDLYYADYLREDEFQVTLDTLHKCQYDCQEALEKVLNIIKAPSAQMVQKKLRDEEVQVFLKGYRKFTKNFFKIRRDFLPQRTTAQLVEYYYLNKHTSNALKNLRRKAATRRQPGGAVVRRMRGRPIRTLSSDFVDLSPSSDEERESDDSDKDLTNYQCSNCRTTESKEWHPTTKDKTTFLCSDCRLFYKKYGELRPTEERENNLNGKPVGDEENNENVAVAKNGPTTRRAVGRPKSALAVNSPEATEKSRSSPGTVSVSSSSSGDQKKKTTRGKGGKNARPTAVVSATPEPPVITEARSPATPNGRKRRKTSASETHSESSFTTECDAPLTEETSAVARVVERAVGTTPPTVASPTAEIQQNFSSLDVHPHVQSAPSVPCLSPKQEVKCEVKPESVMNSSTTSAVMAQPVPVMTRIKLEESATSQSPSPPLDKCRKRDKENVKLALGDIQVDQDETARTPIDGRKFPRERTPDPKPDHVLVDDKDWKSAMFTRVWNRGENNSCARTDLAYCPKSSSVFGKRRNVPPAMASPSKPATKSPAPPAKDKDGKRTPMVSHQSSSDRDRERERDNRSVTTVSSGSRIADTPPRDRSLLQRQTTLNGLPGGPHMSDPILHGPGGPFAGMPPHFQMQQERMRLMEMDRERSLQFARAGSVPPGMIPGMSPHEALELQRRMQHPGLMGMFPGGMSPQMAANFAAAAEQQQQQQMMAAMMAMGAGGPPPPHNPAGLMAYLQTHPEMHHDPAVQYMLSAGGAGGGGGNPFGPYPGPPQLSPEMMHMMAAGRPGSFEHQQFMAQQAQAAMQQQHQQQRDMDNHLRLLHMSGLPHTFHPDMLR